MDMKNGLLALLLIVIIILSSNARASYWGVNVETNSSSWSIYRQNSNISFDLSSSVKGNISPIDISSAKSRSRILRPYQSYYANVGNNDVRFKQRTSSLEGSYKSTDEIMMQSFLYLDDISISTVKPAGTDLFTIEYSGEKSPVIIKGNRTLAYFGQGINDRDFEGNSGDFAGANFLYNRELTKEQKTVMWLQRMNATVKAVDDGIVFAEFKPTKYLGYEIKANTTGIADLSYRFRDTEYNVKHRNYPELIMGDERYWGKYDLMRRINMKSTFIEVNDTDDDLDSWLPCCSDGWKDMLYFDKEDFGTDAKGVFDCTCYKEVTTGSTRSG
jgi:hypothetical protein